MSVSARDERKLPMMSWLMPAPQVIRDNLGDERFLGRRLAVHLDGHFYCPAAHRIAHAFPRSEDTVKCPQRGCGLVFFALGHAVMGDNTPITFACEITEDELKRIRRLNGRAVLEYLGVTWGPSHIGQAERR